ncbi:MAG: M1 family metallopeptidase [Candidatus Kapaibacterium sp.]
MRIILSCLVLVAACGLHAQTIPGFLMEGEGKVAPTEESMGCAHAKQGATLLAARRPSAIVRRPYDVVSYDLFMDWRTPLTKTGVGSREYTGRNTIRVRIDSAGTKVVTLDIRDLRIDSAFVRGVLAGRNLKPTTGTVDIPVGSTSVGDTLTLDVYYTNVSLSNPGDFNGFVAVPAGPFGTRTPPDTVFAPIAYTMSQPEGAREWMPCNDRPYDKAVASITVVVPPGFNVCSNGTLVRYEAFAGGEEYRWQDDVPIPTYLMVVCASKWAKFDGVPYRRVTDTAQSVPAPIYLWTKDAERFADNLTWMQNVNVVMMEQFSRLYGEYPFGSYAQTLLFPYFNGAMEHQTNSTFHRRALTDRWENVIAHELMHQWTGDKVTCATWNDIWLNEGGASYGEFLWIEKVRGIAAARAEFAARRDRSYFGNDEASMQPAIYYVPFNNLFNYGTTYVKAGWVYSMLRTLVGDSTYFSVMNEYFRRNAYRSVETEDFLALWEELVPMPKVPFRQFFDQWIYSSGHPYYSATVQSVTRVDDQSDVVLRFTQKPGPDTKAAPIFIMPVPLRFHARYSNDTFDYLFVNDSLEQTVTVRVPFLCDTMIIDEDQTLLCMKPQGSVLVSVDDAGDATDAAPHLSVVPQPVTNDAAVTIRYKADVASRVAIDLWDDQGRCIATPLQGSVDQGMYALTHPVHGYASGVYTVRLRVGEKIFFSTFIVAR